MWIFFCTILLALANPKAPPTYEKEISEKNRVQAETRADDQKSFYHIINLKTQEMLRYLRENKEEFRKQQETLRKDLEVKIKAEMEEFKKQDPKASMEALRKAANNKRRELYEKLNAQKKSLEEELEKTKKSFDAFVKEQKEKFQQELKVIAAKANATKMPPTASPIEQEFREIPDGPSIILSPNN
jgi:glutamyl/glutaminyl-tRNA synthetase